MQPLIKHWVEIQKRKGRVDYFYEIIKNPFAKTYFLILKCNNFFFLKKIKHYHFIDLNLIISLFNSIKDNSHLWYQNVKISKYKQKSLKKCFNNCVSKNKKCLDSFGEFRMRTALEGNHIYLPIDLHNYKRNGQISFMNSSQIALNKCLNICLFFFTSVTLCDTGKQKEKG